MGCLDPSRLFTAYAVDIQFHGLLAGGVPRDPKVMEAWLLKGIPGISPEEIFVHQVQTMRELGYDVPEQPTLADLLTLADDMGDLRSVNAFKRGARGLFIESRQIKALIKECTNILFAGEAWKEEGQKTRGKGPRNFVAERVFVNPDRIYLGTFEPTRVETTFGHVVGPQGPRSMIQRFEVVERPRIQFEIIVVRDSVVYDNWNDIWVLGEQNGIGASRSQGYGRFEVLRLDRLKKPTFGFHGLLNDPANVAIEARELALA